MGVASFFDRIYGAVGGHLAISRESLLRKLGDISVGVDIASAEINDKWIAELIVNLASRLYPSLAISGDREVCDALRDRARKINPGITISDRAARELTISVGAAARSGAIFASASGWQISVGCSPTESDRTLTNPYSAGAAACIACAQLFRSIFIDSAELLDVKLSLLDFAGRSDVALSEYDFDTALVAGLGAVGNAAIWALSRDATLSGHLVLVDHEELTLSNLQRYVLADMKSVDKNKGLVVERALRQTRITTSKHKQTLEDFAATHGTQTWKAILVSVDNVSGRRAAQALLPELAISGWTGDRALGASWHRFDNGAACLACLYHPHGQGMSAIDQAARALGLSIDRTALLWATREPMAQSDIEVAANTLGADLKDLEKWRGRYIGDLYTQVVCGAVALDVNGLGRVEAVPLAHQSALAGILMASQFRKRMDPRLSGHAEPEPLVIWDDVLRNPPSRWLQPRGRERGCICGDLDYQSAYKKIWRDATAT